MLRVDLYTDIDNLDADTKRVNEVIRENFVHENDIEVTVTLEREKRNNINGLKAIMERTAKK